jgi:Hemolysin-type calcium-binding repeat (2 copies).
MDAVAAQQALALAEAASKAAADAAAKAAADAALQSAQTLTLDLNAGSILNLTGSLGSGTVTVTVTSATGTTTTTVQVLLSQQAQEALNSITGHETTTIPTTTTTTTDFTQSNSMDFSASLLPVHVDLTEHYYYFGQNSSEITSLSPGIVNINGTDYNDTIIGNASLAGALSGGAGDDVITAGSGNNSISGGDGNDTITAGDGNNTISGGDGNDHITVGNGDNYISGGPGNDIIITGNGNNIIDTGTGHDSVHTGSGNDAIFVGTDLTADDTINGGAGTDTLYFTDNGQGTDELTNVKGIEKIILGDATTNISFPNDGTFSQTDWADIGGVFTVDGRALSATHTLTFDGSQTVHGAFNIMGGAGNDTITGGHGDDTIEGMGGDDLLNGREGTNTVSYAHASAGVTVDLNVSTAQNTIGAGTDTLLNFQNIIGSAYADHLTAASTGSVMTGGGGADTLIGSASADTFVYTTQSDVAAGETITADSLDTVKVTGSVDFRAAPGITNFGTIEVAGDGLAVTFSRAQLYEQDTVTFTHGAANTADSISVYLDTTNNSVDASTANITGNIAGDVLRFFGSTGADTITGSSLGDIISGGAGADSLSGGGGNDTIIGGAGADTIHGGTGTDVLDYSQESGTSAIAFDTVPGGITDTHGDHDTVSGIEVIKLNDATTSLTPTDSIIYSLVDSGTTTLTIDGSALTAAHSLTVHGEGVGSGYKMALTGGAGADTLLGGAGNDTITGGAGADSLNGGAGNDTYVFNGGDVVTGEHLTDTSGTSTLVINGAVDLSKAAIALDPGSLGNQLTHVIAVEGGAILTLGPSPALSMGAEQYADVAVISDGNNTAVVLQGTAGNDVFSLAHLSFDSFTGTVSIVGAGGSDTLDLSSSVDGMHVNVGAGSITDITTPMSAQVVFNGISGFLLGSGSDVFEGGSGADNVYSGAGNDSLVGNAGNDTLLAGNGNDTFYGGAGADDMQGGTGANVFVFNPGDVSTGEMVVSGGSGTLETHGDVDFSNLTLLAIGGAKILDMHDKDATVTMNAAQVSGQTWSVAANNTNETLLLNGTSGADSIDVTHFTASGQPNIEIDGKAGADAIVATGLAASLTLNGGAGADTMTGGTQYTDFVFNTGDVVTNEHINIIDNAGSASSSFDIQTSTDFTSGSIAVLNDAGAASTHAATLFLDLGAGATATFLASQLAGPDGNLDVILRGSSQADTTETLVIKDTNAGGTLNGGVVSVYGNWAAGEDVLRFEGGTGQDTLDYSSLHDNNGVDPVALRITAGATAGSGTVDFTETIHGDMDMYVPVEHTYTGIESIIGGAGNDTFIGGSYANAFSGGAGDDSIVGGAGNDTLDGGAGNDTINGGGGADVLVGGGGTNTFIFNTGDVAAGETLEFANDSTNIIQVNSTTDFSHLDHLYYDGSNVAVRLALNGDGVGATFNAGDLPSWSGTTNSWQVIGSTGVQTFTLNGTSGGDTIDLSHLTFSNWTAGEDVLTINGHDGNDTITGSSANDVIVVGNGADVVNGGAGADTLDYSQGGGAQAISITGTVDTIGSDDFREITNPHGNTDLVTGIEKIVLNDVDYTGANAITLGNVNLAYLTDISATTFTLDGSHLTGAHALSVDGSEATHYNLALLGGAGNDSLVGSDGNDTLSGGAGNDTLNGGGGSNTLDYSHETGGAAIHIDAGGLSITDSYGNTDTIGDGSYGHVNAIVLNDADYTGANTITLHETTLGVLMDPDTPATFTIDGSHLTAGHGLDVDTSDAGTVTLHLVGGAGDDHFTVMPISDVPTEHFDGGAGTDTLDYSHYTGGTVFFDTTDAIVHCGWDGSGATAGDDYVTGIEKVVLSEGDYSGDHALTITDSFMTSMFGADTAATFTVDASHFVTNYGVAIDGSDLQSGHDLVFVSGPGDDTIIGGENGGHTIVSYETATDNLNITLDAYGTVHFEAYPCGADTLDHVNGVITGSGDDTIQVANGADYYLDGGAGNDTITGGEGNDMLFGHAGTNALYGMGGDDTFFGGEGDNIMDGGDGTNTVSYVSADYAVTVNLAGGYAHEWNGAAVTHTDTLTNIQNIVGSSHNDWLFGDANGNAIDGGAGNDTIMGGGGADTLTGGTGADVFHFKTDDATVEITDFTHGTDTIQINTGSGSAYSAMSSGWSFNTVSDGSSHSGTSATATLTYDTLTHTLYYDADGTGTASSAVAVAHFSNSATVTQTDITTTAVTPTGH